MLDEQVFDLLEKRTKILISGLWDGLGTPLRVRWKSSGDYLATIGSVVQSEYDLLEESIRFMNGCAEMEIPGAKTLLTPDQLELATDLELREVARGVAKHSVWVGQENLSGRVWLSWGGDATAALTLLHNSLLELTLAGESTKDRNDWIVWPEPDDFYKRLGLWHLRRQMHVNLDNW